MTRQHRVVGQRVAINGGRAELVDTARRIARDVAEARFARGRREAAFASRLYLPEHGEVD